MKNCLDLHRPQIEAEIGELAWMFTRQEHSFYLVGGRVRDAMLGQSLSNDIDITTDAHPEQVKQILEEWSGNAHDQGARFGTVAAHMNGVDVEVTTFRSETYRHDSRKPDVEFSDDVNTDLSRRDFTINAIAVKMPDWELVDPHGGAADLERRVLRTPSDPDDVFSDDPLRMLRAARFLNRFHLRADPETTDAVARNCDRIKMVAPERLGTEISKLLDEPQCWRGLDYLQRTGVLDATLEGVGATEPLSQIDKDFDSAVEPDPGDRWAALLGKDLSPKTAVSVMRRMAVDSSYTKNAEHVLEAAQSLKSLPDEPTDADIRRFVGSVREHNWRPALNCLWSWKQWPGSDLVHRIVATNDAEGIELRILPIEGNEISRMVGGQGPRVGEAIKFLKEHQYEHGPVSRDEARELVASNFGNDRSED